VARLDPKGDGRTFYGMPTATKASVKPVAPRTPRKSGGALSRARLLARLRREYTPALRAATLRLNDALPVETV
jgi:hypothetical protein